MPITMQIDTLPILEKSGYKETSTSNAIIIMQTLYQKTTQLLKKLFYESSQYHAWSQYSNIFKSFMVKIKNLPEITWGLFVLFPTHLFAAKYQQNLSSVDISPSPNQSRDKMQDPHYGESFSGLEKIRQQSFYWKTIIEQRFL